MLDELDAEFGFALDAAATAGHEAFPGRPHFGPGSPLGEDALEEDWAETARRQAQITGGVPLVLAAFNNPPYSKIAGRGEGILAWHRKAWQESREGLSTVLLCPPHPGRRWFHHYAVRADEVRVYRRRIGFIDPETGLPVDANTQDSALIIYRPGVPVEGWPGGPRWSWIDVPKGEKPSPLFDGLGPK